MAQPLPQRFLVALDAAAPDTLVSAVCRDFEEQGLPVAELLDLWSRNEAGFHERYQELAVDGRRAPLSDDEINERRNLYLRELELYDIDEEVIDRSRAATASGAGLTAVIKASEMGPDHDPVFRRREEEILLRETVRAEDLAARIASMTAKEAEAAGCDFRMLSQLTTYLKTRSLRHMDLRRLKIEVEGGVDHHHHLAGRAVFGELQATAERHQLPAARVEIVEVA